jgi:uncharacterized protein YukE
VCELHQALNIPAYESALVIGVAMDIVPTEVVHAAALGRAQHEGLAGTYASTQSRGWDAEAGWVGRSGAALSRLLDRWQSHAGAHHRLLNDHHHALDTAATVFFEMEDRNARRLKLVS